MFDVRKVSLQRKNSCILPHIINRYVGWGEIYLWALTKSMVIFPQTKKYGSEGHSTR